MKQSVSKKYITFSENVCQVSVLSNNITRLSRGISPALISKSTELSYFSSLATIVYIQYLYLFSDGGQLEIRISN